MLTVAELIKKLQELPGDYLISGTNSGSLCFREEDGPKYGYVFTDHRQTLYLTDRQWENLKMLRERLLHRGSSD